MTAYPHSVVTATQRIEVAPPGNGIAAPMKARLVLRRSDVVRAFQDFAKVLRRRLRGEMTFRFADGHLTVKVPGARVALAASGNWSGTAVTRLDLVRVLRSLPASTDALVLSVADNLLRVEGTDVSFTFECEWDEAVAPSIGLSVTASVLEVLAAAEQHGEAQLRSAGLVAVVSRARKKRDTAIERAGRHLASFGVVSAELRALVDRHVRERIVS